MKPLTIKQILEKKGTTIIENIRTQNNSGEAEGLNKKAQSNDLNKACSTQLHSQVLNSKTKTNNDLVIKGADLDYLYFASKKVKSTVKTVFFRSNRSNKLRKRKFFTKYFKEHLTENFLTFMVKNDLNLAITFHDNNGNASRPDIKIKYEARPFDEETNSLEICKAKDLTYLSDKNYDKFRKIVNKNMSSLYYVRKARNILNKKLFKIYRNNFGNFVNAEHKISSVIRKKLKNMNIKDNEITVKLCGDGTQAGKKNTIFNFCFTLPQEGKIAKTSIGNYTLGIFSIKKENYETLNECLAELSSNLSDFFKKGLTITEEGKIINYKIRFLLSGDMKFLRASMGLNGCNSNFSCTWCKEETKNFQKNNLYECRTKNRSIKDLDDLKRIDGLYDEKDGYQNQPIFDFIELTDVVFDTLHMLLRITGKLLKIIMKELIILDDGNTSCLDKMPNQKKLFDYLIQIGIKLPYKINKNDDLNIIELRSFNGNESLIILKEIDFNKIFLSIEFSKSKNNEFNKIFHDFHNIFMKIKQNFYIENSYLLKNDADEWLKTFTKSFHAKHVTPYMHLFASHLCFFVDDFGDVDLFNIQGLEKLNDKTTKQYFSTNRQRFYTFQMINKRNRLEHYTLEEKNINNTVKKRIFTHRLKKIRQDIFNNEDKKLWCCFIINNNIINNLEIRSLNNNEPISQNLVQQALFMFKTERTLVLNEKEFVFLMDENFDELNHININYYKFIAALINDSSLIFISIDLKSLYFIDFLQNDKIFKNRFLKTWIKYTNSLKSNEQNDWKVGNFKHSDINERSNFSIGLLFCFEHLVSSKLVCKFKSDTLKAYRTKIYKSLKSNSMSLNNFCTFCAKTNDLNNDSSYFECQCSRKIHRSCLDLRYITKDLYHYDSFMCFFCRNYR